MAEATPVNYRDAGKERNRVGGRRGALIHFLELEQMCRTSGVPLLCLGVL